MNDRAFLGAGMKFPPQIDPGTGRFAVSAREQSVRESVYLILMTSRGERWLEPNFGSQMASYAFMDTSPTMLRMLSDDLRDLLLTQEPRISDVDVEIDPETKNGCLLVSIQYTVAATNSRDNLVFPFYLNAAREEPTL
ncbi:MAG: GPW/gp25 family protein [Oscillospiraceae bacterium]|uniref:GPW/gp25 family protein n=1 Tax=Oscillibacter sp. TaxID=1945593 RepID=UPI001B74B601|nr:GPW/gp25 family protein [Oscillibacter sp.]MBP3486756.1 GPW/gp25 family protein [Oscillospiraceae bacterium]MBP3509851.1 GPW/gp25 family protein [Oscillibacter sp.]